MNMNKVFITFIFTLISINAISQNTHYRKDDRPKNVKEDSYNEYQSDLFGEVKILKALEMVGVRIFDFPISPVFEKEYRFSVFLNEYIEGEKVKSNEVFPHLF